MFVLQTLVFLSGLFVVITALMSAVRTFVLPRSAPDPISRAVFVFIRRLFNLRLWRVTDYLTRDRVMALYAPVALLSLLPTWLALVMAGYAGMYWATGVSDSKEAVVLSGSSLLTLGFARQDGLLHILLTFSEATLGLILVALLIAYLPTMYSAFQVRERAVTLLEVRAGTPPSAVEMILRFKRLGRLDRMDEIWNVWETWFAEIEESHTSLAALVFFRSPQPDHSWVTAAGAVLDAAALVSSTVDIAQDVQIALCIRAGYLALERIADFFRIAYNPDPNFPDDPISIAREEFEQAYDRLHAAGVPLYPDREAAWLHFAGWRVNYDRVLVGLSSLTQAPTAPWASDRGDVTRHGRPR
jgi:hypothetical protein